MGVLTSRMATIMRVRDKDGTSTLRPDGYRRGRSPARRRSTSMPQSSRSYPSGRSSGQSPGAQGCKGSRLPNVGAQGTREDRRDRDPGTGRRVPAVPANRWASARLAEVPEGGMRWRREHSSGRRSQRSLHSWRPFSAQCRRRPVRARGNESRSTCRRERSWNQADLDRQAHTLPASSSSEARVPERPSLPTSKA